MCAPVTLYRRGLATQWKDLRGDSASWRHLATIATPVHVSELQIENKEIE